MPSLLQEGLGPSFIKLNCTSVIGELQNQFFSEPSIRQALVLKVRELPALFFGGLSNPVWRQFSGELALPPPDTSQNQTESKPNIEATKR